MKTLFYQFNRYAGYLMEPSLILSRLALGYVFLLAGWGKLNNLDRTIGFFESLNIPLASLQAPFVAGMEFIGGIALILGLLTRFFSVTLAFVMVVAILTAKMSDIGSLNDLFTLYEFTYILIFLFLAAKGAGKFSVDNKLNV